MKARKEVELDIEKIKSLKEDLKKLCSQLEKDFENLMSKVAEEKKSTHILEVEAVPFERIRDEKFKEIKKLDKLIENLGKRKEVSSFMTV